MKKISPFFSLALALVLTISVMAIPTTVLAKTDFAPGDPALKQALQAEQKWLNIQQDTINKADLAASKVQEVIDKAAAEGLDVTSLQNALGVFNNAMSNSKGEHQAAANLLNTHNGFDGSGEVTDRQSARQMILDTRQHLMQAHVSLVQATRNLHQAVLDWRSATFGQN
ncbi:MAG: hypothetical protein U0Z26_01365 [Anaerolineales bacterium]